MRLLWQYGGWTLDVGKRSNRYADFLTVKNEKGHLILTYTNTSEQHIYFYLKDYSQWGWESSNDLIQDVYDYNMKQFSIKGKVEKNSTSSYVIIDVESISWEKY